jgi:uncharacterized protein
MDKGTITAAVQVCWELNKDNLEREISGLLEAMKSFKLLEGTIVTLALNDHFVRDGLTVKVIPYHEFVAV